MKNRGRTGLSQVIFWGLLAVAAVALLWFMLSRDKGPPTGTLCPMVVDGRTEQPLSDCTIVVPETGFSTVTGEDGRAVEPFAVPVERPQPKNGMEQQQWGECTLLIYKDGYIPYALFHTQVWEGVDRNGPKIYLFPDDGTTHGQPYSVIEGPDRAWVNALVEKFDPRMKGSE
ncbi:MAG: hypothetical protein ACOYIR_02475 [Christensenellales bacterium]